MAYDAIPSGVKALLRPAWYALKRLPVQLSEWWFGLVLAQRPIRVAGLLFEPHSRKDRIRVQGILDKEPGTIAWIESSVSADDVFYDIGANIGTFTLYAGRKARRVVAFEPHFANYRSLNVNIALNNMSAHVTAYNCALSDSDGVGVIELPAIESGISGGQYRSSTVSGEQSRSDWFRQGVVTVSLDHFVAMTPDDWHPNHIKLDVDGLEWDILNGMEKALADKRLKSVLVEASSEEYERFLTFFTERGFILNTQESIGQAKVFRNCIFTRS